MKNICNIILILLISVLASAEESGHTPQVDELTQAYQREILFLSTYKRELQSKIETVKGSLGKKVIEAEAELKQMENHWLKSQTDNEVMPQKLGEIERDYENKQENRELLQTTLKQAQYSEKNTAQGVVDNEAPLLEQIKKVYFESTAAMARTSQVTMSPGTFYLKSGEEQKGNIIQLGAFARYAEDNGKIAALYPSGGGTFRVWKWLGSEAASLKQSKIPGNIQFFLYENAEKEFTAQKEKTIMDVMQAGGLIGWIIVVMGIFALIISGLRFLLLRKAETSNTGMVDAALAKVKAGEISEAQHILLRENNAVGRVLNKTLSYLKTEPQKVEDAIMEAILKESQTIDRFGVVILVIASVAPLMGLLGTVTGMISTFDIITLYGTGNPKLLSGGISEALVTTMFGLIVAIPALLIGQYLSSKTENIKNDMEKWALATCNAYNNQKGEA